MIPIKYTLQGKHGDVSDALRMDASTHSLQTIEYEHHEIHSGSHFFVNGYLDILGANDVLDFTWQMPKSTKQIHWTWQISFEKGLTWSVYEDVIATNPLGNTITPYNNNRNSQKTSSTTMKYALQVDLAAANADTNVTGATLLSTGKVGDNRTAGDSERSNEMIMKSGSLYCLRAATTAAGYINFDMEWYEHTPRD